jgi:SSS family solute:Na+ symporter
LYSILGDSLGEPDLAFPYLVKTYLPIGIKGIVLCGLFASLMSTVDSTFNSLATLWSVDIYSKYINKTASDQEKIKSGRMAIIFSLVSGLTMGLILLYLKFDNPDSAFTHTLNNLRYYINCGIVVLICSAVILVKPKEKNILLAFLLTLPINFLFQFLFPEMNYFVRAFWVIFSGISIAILGNIEKFNRLGKIVSSASLKIQRLGILLLISLILIHILFH